MEGHYAESIEFDVSGIQGRAVSSLKFRVICRKFELPGRYPTSTCINYLVGTRGLPDRILALILISNLVKNLRLVLRSGVT